jgi:hypothetical protein
MKKILILLCATLLSGCGCILSQIPPQKIYAGSGCTTPLPDYRLKITASDNCEISSFTQIPVPGFILTATNKVANVVLKATDASGNFRQVAFTVTLLDTIKPTFTIAPDLLAVQMEQIGDIYDYGDKLIAFQQEMIDKQIADTNVFPESLYPNLRNVYEDSTYYKKTMLTWTAKGHAMTGYGRRFWTWYDADKDSIIIRR